MSTPYNGSQPPVTLQLLPLPVQDTDVLVVQRVGDNIVRGATALNLKTYTNGSVVNSIAALRAATTTTVPVSVITVGGYYSAGGGGGGPFVVNAADVSSADNGGTIIVDASGRRWYSIFSWPISLQQFGAKCDGVTNDTAAVQTAINWVNSLGGGALSLPPGLCRVANLQGAQNISWVGVGNVRYFNLAQNNSTFLLWTGATKDILGNGAVTAAGSGYSTNFLFTLASPGGGRSAQFRCMVSAGAVVGVICVDCGSKFTADQNVTLVGGGGTNATATLYASACVMSGNLSFNNFIGINILGDGVSTLNSMGIVGIVGSNYFYFDTFGAFNTWLQGIKQCADPVGTGDVAFNLRNSFVECVVRTSGATFYAGAVEFWGSDACLSDNEIGAASSGDQTNLWNTAIYVAGANAVINNTKGEGADTGLMITGVGTMLGTGTHSEICFGHGIWVTRVMASLQPPQLTQANGVKVINCSRYASNTFDAVHIQDGQSITGGLFNNVEVTGTTQRYDFYEGTASNSKWDLCPPSGTAVTGWFHTGSAGSQGPEANCYNHSITTLTANSTTPTVTAGDTFLQSNSVATAVSKLLGGITGQTVSIRWNLGNTTIAHGSIFTADSIVTRTGADLTPNGNLTYQFQYQGQSGSGYWCMLQ